MASIAFDKSTGWWCVRYLVAPDGRRVKKPLCKHPTAWSPSRPPRSVPPEVRRLATPFEEIERRVKASGQPHVVDVPLATHLRAYLETYALTHRPNSVRVLRGAVDKFLAFCEARRVRTLQGVTPAVCAAWVSARLAEAKPSTVRTDRAYLAAAWAKARLARIVPENPWEFAPVERPRSEELPKFWTEDELKRLIASLDGWLRDWVILDANTGLRVSALIGLRWGDVDFAANTLTVPPHLSKSGRPYSVPLTPIANETLARRWSEASDTRPGAFVFANPATGRPYRRRTVQARMAYAVKKSGIRDFGHYCHAVRHSFAVALVNADVSIRVIQALLGHATVRTTEVYARLAPGKAEAIMNGFEIAPDRGRTPSSAASDDS